MVYMKRSVGYCLNESSSEDEGCEEYAKGVFLLNHGDKFTCSRCRKRGKVVRESGHTERIYDAPFKEVRVEFNYDPIAAKFQDIAIVRDESIWGRSNKYLLKSPLIKTERRALKVAEAILGNLQRWDDLFDGEGIPNTREFVISWDDSLPEFTRKLAIVANEWEKSTLVRSRPPRALSGGN